MQCVHAHGVEQMELGPHHIVDRDGRKVCTICRLRLRIETGRARGAVTGPQDVRADHKILVGIQRAPRPDELFPPPRSRVDVAAGRMSVRRQAGVQQDHVVSLAASRNGSSINNGTALMQGPRRECATYNKSLN